MGVVRMIGELSQALTISTKPESGTCEEASCSKKEERVLPEMQEGTCQVHDDTLPESRMGMRGGLGGRRGWSSTPAKLGWRDGTCLLIIWQAAPEDTGEVTKTNVQNLRRLFTDLLRM